MATLLLDVAVFWYLAEKNGVIRLPPASLRLDKKQEKQSFVNRFLSEVSIVSRPVPCVISLFICQCHNAVVLRWKC